MCIVYEFVDQKMCLGSNMLMCTLSEDVMCSDVSSLVFKST
jgi:hypothetical protein